jgi:hypothetical protein
MEERQIIRCHKFGVVMLLPGQTLEHQGLTNTRGKRAMVKINGWEGGWQGKTGPKKQKSFMHDSCLPFF